TDVAQNGTIKRLVMDRGFGFLSGEDGKEYFFHRSSVEGSFEGLQEGQKVSFDVEASAPKGPRASRVRVASDSLNPESERPELCAGPFCFQGVAIPSPLSYNLDVRWFTRERYEDPDFDDWDTVDSGY